MLLNYPDVNYQQSFMPYVDPRMSQYYNIFGGGSTGFPDMGQYFQGTGIPNTGLLSTTPNWFKFTPHTQAVFDPNYSAKTPRG